MGKGYRVIQKSDNWFKENRAFVFSAKSMTKVLISVVLLFVIISCNSAINRKSAIQIIPKPNYIEIKKGSFLLNKQTVVKYDSTQFLFAPDFIKEYLKNYTALGSLQENIISLEIDKNLADIGEEGYHLEITDTKILISALTEKGIFYGLQSLVQLIHVKSEKKNKIEIPQCVIKDKPSFKWRGMHLDVSRHFMPISFVKKFIDLLAMHKMNAFHWHLTDDQGWRVEIKKYPKLTEIGAWRVDRRNESWWLQRPIQHGEKSTYGGFYTQGELRDIVAYAAKRAVTIIPEIEMPTHSVAAIASYPELSCNSKQYKVKTGGNWPNSNILCAGNEKTFEFLENVLNEVLDIFPSKYIHIGGDEAYKISWESCPKCQARIKSEKLKNEKELQSYFIKRIEKFLISKNRKIVGWDEILEGGLAPDATVMSWRGIAGGIESAKQGHDVIMSPNNQLYFDMEQAEVGEPVNINNLVSLEKVYHYNPIPTELNKDEQKYVIGAEGCLWTEYMHDENQVEYQAFPRECALSEILWTERSKQNYDEFLERLSTHFFRLDKMDVNYRHPKIQGFEKENVFIDKAKVRLSTLRKGAKICYTLDGSEPTIKSHLYTNPIIIKDESLLTAQAFIDGEKVGSMKQGSFKLVTPIPSVKVENLEQGVSYSYYDGVEKISELGEPILGVLDSLMFPEETPNTKPSTNFTVVYTGFIKIEKTGVYRFYLWSTNSTKLTIDGNTLSNMNMLAPNENTMPIALEAGYHSFEMFYRSNFEDYMAKISYSNKDVEKAIVPKSMLFHK